MNELKRKKYRGELYNLDQFLIFLLYTKMGETRNVYRILVGKPEGKRSLRRPRCRWVDDIKIDLREMGWYGQDRSGSG
jgi:hypothetical protein